MNLCKEHKRTLSWSPLLALLLSAPCWADPAQADQPEPRHFIEAGLGPGVHQISDDIVRGLRWRGPSLELDASYRYATVTDRHEGFLRMGGAYLENRYGHAAASVSHHLGYGFTRRVHTGRWGTLFLGGQVREDVDRRTRHVCQRNHRPARSLHYRAG